MEEGKSIYLRWDRWRGGYLRITTYALWFETYWFGLILWSPMQYRRPASIATVRFIEIAFSLYFAKNWIPRIKMRRMGSGWRRYRQ